ncbi:MAG: complex I 51 kDa subunit family protein [Patescibacteria group bacterium]
MKKIITQNWDKIDSFSMESYLKYSGYQALQKALKQNKPEEIVKEIKESRLQGRGGAGFPAGEKWETVAGYSSSVKYLVCNLDESEPGNFKDKTLAEKNPHQILEGCILAAYATGAEKGYIYLNGNFKEAGRTLEKALEQALENNFLGKEICGSDFNFDLEIFQGAGAYICGEESAMINSIEGKRGEPRAKPPYPCEVGLFGKPTLVNNAETLANIPWIINNGSWEFQKLGMEKSPGTKLFSIDGAVRFPGLYEEEIGKTVGDLISCAGGIKPGCEINFVQVGGSSGRIVPAYFLDRAPSYSKEAEVRMGSGSLLIIDKSEDLKKIIQGWIDFFQRESCGKCVPCREGTFRLKGIIERLNNGNFDQNDKEDLKKLVWLLDKTTFCPLGRFSVTGLKDVIEYKMIEELQ